MENTNRPGLWAESFGGVGATLKALQDNGVTLGHLTRLRAEPAYAQRVAEFIRRGGLSGEIKYASARHVLGSNFFGPEEWLAEYAVNLTQEQFQKITNFPWSVDVLNSPCPFVENNLIKHTHFAFLGVESIDGKPLSILRWINMISFPSFYANMGNYIGEDFARKETCRLRWYLMPKSPVLVSLGKDYGGQLSIVPPNYELATGIEEVTKLLLYHRKTGIFLNSNVDPHYMNRCKSVYKAKAAEGSHVSVGWFVAIRETLLEVNRHWDNTDQQNIGIALSMKP